jgi:hypothetical protein
MGRIHPVSGGVWAEVVTFWDDSRLVRWSQWVGATLYSQESENPKFVVGVDLPVSPFASVDKAFDPNRNGIDLKLMHNPRRAAIRCAFVGLILAGASYLYVTSLHDWDYFKGPPHLLAISWILCPAQLLLAWDGPITCFLIGALNASLYALAGFWIATVTKKKPDNSLRIQ